MLRVSFRSYQALDGSLENYLKKVGKIKEEEATKYIIQIALVVQELHRK